MLQNIPHQVVQSPARLGLPNPNSSSPPNPNQPKFSTQTSQFHPPPQSSNQLTTPAISSTLLPLLPPLPRAQSLLIQMASLASRLFEVSPNRSHWIGAYRGSLPTFLSLQTHTLSPAPPDSSPPSIKEILAQFTYLQTQLFEAASELQEILDLQDAKQKFTHEIRSKDSAFLAFANKVKEAEHVLDILVDDYSDYCRSKRTKPMDDVDDSSTTTVATHLKLSDILSYAHKISYTTFAPPEFGAGQAPLRGALPPAPQEEQGLIPQNIVVPSGWKPGMPVELPGDLPILHPPGWKAGDPFTLPPLDSLPVLAIVEEQQLRPIPPLGLAKVPQAIQVRHVQLDIEDDSSDYSSEIGSSDSED